MAILLICCIHNHGFVLVYAWGTVCLPLCQWNNPEGHYDDVIMDSIASQITSLTIVYPTVHSDADQSKHQSSASLAFVWEIHRWPVNFPHKWPVTRKMFSFDDVIMIWTNSPGTKLQQTRTKCERCPWSAACIVWCLVLRIYFKADSRFAPSQWETVLLCNDVSHCLGASLESTLYFQLCLVHCEYMC